MLLTPFAADADNEDVQKFTAAYKEAYNNEMCEYELEDLEWRKANLLIALNKAAEAKDELGRIVKNDGIYKEQADSLLNVLSEKK